MTLTISSFHPAREFEPVTMLLQRLDGIAPLMQHVPMRPAPNLALHIISFAALQHLHRPERMYLPATNLPQMLAQWVTTQM